MVLAQNIGTQHANLHQGSGQWGFNHWNGTSVFKQQDAAFYNDAVAQLPKAKSVKLYVKTAEKKVQPLAHFKAIEVTNPDGSIVHVSCPTYKYVEVQHDRAFEPVVEGLKLSGIFTAGSFLQRGVLHLACIMSPPLYLLNYMIEK